MHIYDSNTITDRQGLSGLTEQSTVPYRTFFLLSLLFAFAFQISHFYVFHSAFFILYSVATIISSAGFLILELYKHISVAVFLKILRLDLISIDDYLPLCVCMTGVV